MQPLESRIHYKFRNSLLLAEALTHPSLAYESQKPHFDNQRMEFLGDAVLQLVRWETDTKKDLLGAKVKSEVQLVVS